MGRFEDSTLVPFSLADQLIQVQQQGAGGVLAEVLDNAFASLEAVFDKLIAFHLLQDGFVKIPRRTALCQYGLGFMTEGIVGAAAFDGDDRCAAGLRFDGNQPEGFAGARMDEEVGG